MKVLHTADLHFDSTNLRQTLPAARSIVEGAKKHRPDLAVVAGDLFVKRGYLEPSALWYAKNEFVWGLADICPVVIVSGNHDATNEWDGVDSIDAAFSAMDTRFPVLVCTKPGVHIIDTEVGSVQIAALPTPNKYYYLSQNADAEHVNEAISQKLVEVIRGMIAEVNPSLPSVLVYHGSVVGAKADSEMLMTTGQDIAIDRGAVGDAFDAIMCGHLHSPQEVGRWVYAGAPAPLTFSCEGVEPSWCLWDITDTRSEFERIPIPVAHQLITVEIGPEEIGTDDPTDTAIIAIGRLSPEQIDGARVRLKARIPEHLWDQFDKEAIRASVPDAESLKIDAERVRQSSIRAAEISQDEEIETLLGKWLDVNSDLHVNRCDVLSLAREIESQIPQDARTTLDGADYHPTEIGWKNFKQYKEGEIRFDKLDGRLVCITGPNFSGKSNAAEVEAFVLYKFLRGSSKLKDIVRNGERKLSAWVEFTAGGDTWRVTRSVRLSGTGDASGDLLLEKSFNGTFETVNAGTAPETEKKIRALVGSMELYLATRYRSQFDLDRLLNMKPAELKDTMQLAVPTRLFEIRQGIAKDRRDVIDKDVTTNRVKIEQLDRIANGRDGAEVDLLQYETELDLADDLLKQQKTRLSKVEDDLAARDITADRMKSRRAEFEKHDKEAVKISDEIETIQGSIDSSEAVLKDAGTIREKVDQIAVLDRELLQLQADKEHFDAVQRDIDKATWEMIEAVREADDNVASARLQIERDTKAASLIDGVPCDGQTWMRPGYEPDACEDDDPEIYIDMGKCQFLLDAVTAKENLPLTKRALQELETLRGVTEETEGAKVVTITERLAEIPYKPGTHKEKRALFNTLKREDWETKNLALSEARGQLVASKESMAAAIVRLTTAQADRDNVSVSVSEYAAALRETEAIREDKRTLGLEIESIEKTVSDCQRRIGQEKGKLKIIEDAEKERADLHAAAETGAYQLTLLATYIRAVSRDGLPFLILENRLRDIEEIANDLIGDAPIRLEIEPLAGENKDQVVIRFHDDKGAHPLSEASGFQRRMTAIPLSAALAKVYASSNGGKAYHIFIDEGFGAFRKENYPHGKALLHRLADEFERVVYISDVPEIELVADTTLRVIPCPDGNRIEVVV